jgi:VanZ family protein
LGNLIEWLGKHRWVPAVVWSGLIMVGSTIPDLGPQRFPGCDKVVHFIEYLVLGATLRYWSTDGRWLFLAGGIAFGALDEIHQSIIPTRDASLWDFLADASGMCVGFIFAGRFVGRNRNG